MMQVKICGITNLDDAVVAALAGADLIGFIFYPPSPRSVTARRARRIVEQLRRISPGVRAVGVFVDEKIDTVRRTVDRCGLDAVQLHGSEPPETVWRLVEDDLEVFKAFRVRDAAFLADIARYRPTAYLLDTYIARQHGGTGETFDWTLAEAAAAQGPVLLAGGLTPRNVARAVRTVRPWGVDTASGVEAKPGQKAHQLVRQFIAAAKRASTGKDDRHVRAVDDPA